MHSGAQLWSFLATFPHRSVWSYTHIENHLACHPLCSGVPGNWHQQLSKLCMKIFLLWFSFFLIWCSWTDLWVFSVYLQFVIIHKRCWNDSSHFVVFVNFLPSFSDSCLSLVGPCYLHGGFKTFIHRCENYLITLSKASDLFSVGWRS